MLRIAKFWIGLAGLCAVHMLALPAFAQAPAGAPVRLVIPGGPGGTLDIVARLLADRAAPSLGRPVIVDNRPGAGGSIAADVVGRAAPDGSTVLVGIDSTFTVDPHLSKSGKSSHANLAPVALVGSFPIALVAAQNIPATSLAEFVAYAKANPQKVSYATPGIGTTHHLLTEVFALAAGIELLHVPYKAVEGMTTDLIGGRLSAGLFSLASARKIVAAGGGKLIAISGTTRFPDLNVPTFSESYPSVRLDPWIGVFVPEQTPASTVARLKNAIADITRDPDFTRKLAQAGFAVRFTDTAAFQAQIRKDLAERGDLIQRLKIDLR